MPPKPWRFIVPAKPLPLLTAVTSTLSPSASRSALSSWPDRVVGHVVEAQLDEPRPRVDARLLEVTGLGLGELGGLGRAEGDLEGGVAVALIGLHLDDAAGLDTDHGDGDDAVLVVPHLGHADLLADDCLCRHDDFCLSLRRNEGGPRFTRTLRTGQARRSVVRLCRAVPEDRACPDVSSAVAPGPGGPGARLDEDRRESPARPKRPARGSTDRLDQVGRRSP